MEIQTIEIKKLKPAKYNPRKISDEAFEGLKNSLKTFGLVEPIVVNKNMTIVGGHQRAKAWEALGNTEIPCYIVDLDEIQEKKLNVVLNSQAISGEYDEMMIMDILEELKNEDDYKGLLLYKLEVIDIDELQFEDSEPTDDDLSKPTTIICPNCNHEFTN